MKMMKRLLVIFVLQFMLIEEHLIVASQCSSLQSCTTCDPQGRAECHGVCPSNDAIPRDIKELKITNYNCTASSLVVIKPEDLGYFPILEELDLSNNGIKTLYYGPPKYAPTFMNTPNVKVISLAHNLIVSFNAKIFTNLTHLESLDISNNHLVGMVTNVTSAGWLALKTLNLANNNIKNLDAASLGGVTELKTLILSNNPINNIASEAFELLTHLHTIEINGLPLKEVPAAIFANPQILKQVIASNMSVSTLSDNILRGTSLDKLDLSADQFTSIPTTAIKNSAIHPKILDLSNNKITQISSTDLQGLTVETLNLSGNHIVHIGDKAFDGCTISHIDLSNTGLTSLPVTMETWLRTTTATVNLDNTNWSCTCDTLWLAHVADQKTNITPPKCAASGKYGGTSLKDALPQMGTDCTAVIFTNETTKTTAPAQVNTLPMTTTGETQTDTTTFTTATASSRRVTASLFLSVVGILVRIIM